MSCHSIAKKSNLIVRCTGELHDASDKWSSAWMKREAGGGLCPHNSIQARWRLWQWAGQCCWTDWRNWALMERLQHSTKRGSHWGTALTPALLPQGLWWTAFSPSEAGKEAWVWTLLLLPLLTFPHCSILSTGLPLKLLGSCHVFLKSHPGSRLHHYQSITAIHRFLGEMEGVGVTSGAGNALTCGHLRDPPHAHVLCSLRHGWNGPAMERSPLCCCPSRHWAQGHHTVTSAKHSSPQAFGKDVQLTVFVLF